MSASENIQMTDGAPENTEKSGPRPLMLKAVIDGIQKSAFYRQLVPMESGIGWPIPMRKNGWVYIILPLFGIHPAKEKGKTALYPPFATITLDWKTQQPVEYVDLRFRATWPRDTWEKAAGYFPFAGTAALTAGQYRGKREKILKLYDDIFERLAEKRPFSAEFKAEFRSLLRLLMEPCLEKYYRALAPKFFNHFLTEASGK